MDEQDNPHVLKSMSMGWDAYRWILFTTRSPVKHLSTQEKKLIRFHIRKAQGSCERCYLAVGFVTEEPRIIVLPADKALKKGRIASDTGGINWVELENNWGGEE